MAGKYLENDFKILLRQTVDSAQISDALESSYSGNLLREIIDLPDDMGDLTECDADEILERISAFVETEDNSQAIRNEAKIKKNQDFDKFSGFLVNIAEQDRGRAIRLAQAATRYAFAHKIQRHKKLSKARIDPENRIASSSFTEISGLVGDLSILSGDIKMDAENGITHIYMVKRKTVMPRLWKQAIYAMFSVARRQQSGGAHHFLILNRLKGALNNAPISVSREFVSYADRAMAKRPGHSEYLAAFVEQAVQKFKS